MSYTNGMNYCVCVHNNSKNCSPFNRMKNSDAIEQGGETTTLTNMNDAPTQKNPKLEAKIIAQVRHFLIVE